MVPAIQPSETYFLLYEILAGVGLEKELPTPKQPRTHRNTIIHLISLQERVFSSLYAASPHRTSQDLPLEEVETNLEMKTQGQLLRRFYNGNRVSPALSRQQSIDKDFEGEKGEDPIALEDPPKEQLKLD
jgi:hypothetical protein